MLKQEVFLLSDWLLASRCWICLLGAVGVEAVTVVGFINVGAKISISVRDAEG